MTNLVEMWEDMFPQPLYETSTGIEKKICLVCGKDKSYSVLRTTSKTIVPLCRDCSTDWNWYGYGILKKINPKTLMRSILKYKLLHWFEVQSIIKCCHDLRDFKAWSQKQKKFLKKV